jgi:hypothetical protein
MYPSIPEGEQKLVMLERKLNLSKVTYENYEIAIKRYGFTGRL